MGEKKLVDLVSARVEGSGVNIRLELGFSEDLLIKIKLFDSKLTDVEKEILNSIGYLNKEAENKDEVFFHIHEVRHVVLFLVEFEQGKSGKAKKAKILRLIKKSELREYTEKYFNLSDELKKE